MPLWMSPGVGAGLRASFLGHFSSCLQAVTINSWMHFWLLAWKPRQGQSFEGQDRCEKQVCSLPLRLSSHELQSLASEVEGAGVLPAALSG